MKKITPLKSLALLITLFSAVNFGFGQTCNVSDDFTRSDNTVVGGNWIEIGDDSSITSNELLIVTGGTTARDFVYQDVSGFYNTQLNALANRIDWLFNMQQSRSNPSGFDSNNYGLAFILGGTNSDLTMGNGYAVVLGESGGTDDIRLVEYTNGIDLNSNLTDIVSGITDFGSEHLSIKVSYFPSTDTWELYVRNDGATFADPSTLNPLNLVGSSVNNAYTGTNLDFVAMLYNHASGGGESATFDNVCIYASKCDSIVTWDGTWSGPADITTEVTLLSNYNTSTDGGSFSACSLNIINGATLTIADNDYVEVENDLTVATYGTTFGTITVEPSGAFIQNNDAGLVTNNGTIEVEKFTADMNYWYEYTYWSSPVFEPQIGTALAESDVSRRYKFNANLFNDEYAETNNDNNLVFGFQDDIDDEGDDWSWVSGSTVMTTGVGYATTHDEAGFIQPPMVPLPWQFKYVFRGDFNNGVISVPVERNDTTTADFNWNLIGNPYPSAIEIDAFMTQNMYPAGPLEGAIYFWSQNLNYSSTENGNQAYNFNTTDYATHNGTGGTVGGDGLTPNGFIPSGQGVFVTFSDSAPSNTGTVIFNNAMRSLSLLPDNSQFFKNSNSKKKSTNNPNKLWLNLTSDNGVFNQILVGYIDGATNNDDGAYYDARKIVAPKAFAALYSTIENSDKKYAIQGKDINSINEDELINLGFSTTIDVATLYTLSIAQFEGDFLSNNPIYLKDNLLNQLHDLSASDYTFTSEVGEFNDRFEIVFNSAALSTTDVALNSKSLRIIELEDDRVQFTASDNLKIKSVNIFDLLGRQLYSFKGNNASETYRLSNLHSSIYIAKVALSNGVVVTKKAIKK